MQANVVSEAADIFDFQWPKAVSGYALKDLGPARSTSELLGDSGLHIVRCGNELTSIHPRAVPSLYREFAAIGDTPADVLNFVQKYGFLGIHVGPWQTPRDIQREGVSDILAQRNQLKSALDAFDELRSEESRTKRTWMEMRDYALKTSPEEITETAAYPRMLAGERFNQWTTPRFVLRLRPAGHGLAMHLEPQSLLSLMCLQAAEELAGGIARFAYCERCHKPMPIGKGGGRIDKKTCSDACRVALFAARKKREAELKTAKKSRPAKAK